MSTVFSIGRFCVKNPSVECRTYFDATTTYDQRTNSDNSVTYSNFRITWKAVTDNYNGYMNTCGSENGKCTVGCCNDTAYVQVRDSDFSTTNPSYRTVAQFSLNYAHASQGIGTYSIPGSFTLAPGASTSKNLGRVYTNGCGAATASASFTVSNPNPVKPPTAPTLSPSCSASTSNGNTLIMSGGGSYGYCDPQRNSSSYSIYDSASMEKAIQSGSGLGGTITGLSPNTRYWASFSISNGCYSRSATCSAVTVTPNTLSEPTPVSFDKATVRLAVTNGGGEYDPNTTIWVRPCSGGSWTQVATSKTKAVEVVEVTGLEPETCYEVQARTKTDAGEYVGNTVTLTTPTKDLCIAEITDIETSLNDATYQVCANICYKWESTKVPAKLTLYYRVKDGYDTKWYTAELPDVTELTGEACYEICDLYPNQTVYETYIHSDTNPDGAEYDSSMREFITPVVPEPDIHNCENFEYLTELLCQAVNRIRNGNKVIYANPVSQASCDPYGDDPTLLTLWSRMLRLFHAMYCLVCDMGAQRLSASKPGQYFVGEAGWQDILTIIDENAEADNWKIATSDAIWNYLQNKLHSVWHYHGAIDYILDDLTNVPADASTVITLADNKVYEKNGSSWVEATSILQPDDFSAYHINNASTTKGLGDVNAESAYYYFEGTWNLLDANLSAIEERLAPLKDYSQLIVTEPDSEMKIDVVDEDFDFEKDGVEGMTYFVTEVEKPLRYHTVSFETEGQSTHEVRSQQVPDGAYAQRPSDPTNVDDNCEFIEWEQDKSVITLTCLTPGTAKFNNLWGNPIIISGERVDYTSYIVKDVEVGQKIHYTLPDDNPDAMRVWWGNFNNNYNNAYGLVSSEDGATFEVSVPDLQPFLRPDGSAPRGFFANFCGAYHYNASKFETPAITRIADGSFDTSKITKCEGEFFAGFNYFGILEELPEGSFDLSGITSCGSNFLAQYNYYGALVSLPEGSFNMSNIGAVDSYCLYEFNRSGKLSSLPAGSFSMPKVTTYSGRAFAGFNRQGSLVSLPEGSFNFSNVTNAGEYFCWDFNYQGNLVSLPDGSFDISGITNAPNNFFMEFNAGGQILHLPEGSFNTSGITYLGNNAFSGFNKNGGALIDLPDGSFDLSNVKSCGDSVLSSFNNSGNLTAITPNMLRFSDELTTVTHNFCSSFNSNGAIKEFPEGSLDTSHFKTVGNFFFYNFCSGSSCATTKLPEGSFNISNITSHGQLFFESFNLDGNLRSLPDGSFDTSNFTELRANDFGNFNCNGALESLPDGSFNFSNVEIVDGDYCLYRFNRHTKAAPNRLTTLPKGSFNFDKVESVKSYFACGFFDANSNTDVVADDPAIDLPDGAFSFGRLKTVGDYFCANFNRYGPQLNFGNGAFNISNIEEVGADFLNACFSYSYTANLPEGAFNTSKIRTAKSSMAIAMFSYNSSIQRLPKGSFNFDSLEEVGVNAFYRCFYQSHVSSLPIGSFSFPKLTADKTASSGYFNGFATGTYAPKPGNQGVSFTALHDIVSFGAGYPSPIPAGTTVYLNADED